MANNERAFDIDDFNGVVRKTNRFKRQKGDAWDAQNVTFIELGSFKKSPGYQQRANALTSTTTTSSSTSTTTTSTSTSSSTSTTTSTSTS